eukprot:gene20692-24849_t
MPGAVEYHQLTTRPTPVDRPGSVEWPGNVIPSVHENRGNLSETVHSVQYLIRRQEAVVTPVMRDQPGHHPAEVRILVSNTRSPPRHQRHVHVFPTAPLQRGILAHNRIRIGKQSRVR